MKVYFCNHKNVAIRITLSIKASEMLVAPRISEYFLKFKKLKIWKIWKILENLENLENFGKFGNFWSALVYINLPWSA